MSPHARIRSLPPEGANASFEAARQDVIRPHARIRSLPPEGANASFEAARQES
jgi:hypothetical protein